MMSTGRWPPQSWYGPFANSGAVAIVLRLTDVLRVMGSPRPWPCLSRLWSQPRWAVTIDTGIVSHAGVARLQADGIPFIVTNHHVPAETLPPAYAVVNPRRADDTSSAVNVAGVGVAFLLAIAIRERLLERDGPAVAPSLAPLLPLVTLGMAFHRIQDFTRALKASVSRYGTPDLFCDAITTDGILAVHECTLETAHALEAGGPWGRASWRRFSWETLR